jgi:hypothetical protein
VSRSVSEGSTTRKIVEALERRHADAGLLIALAERLTTSELGSLLLFAFRERAARTRWAEVLRFAEANSLVRPSSADARTLHQIDTLAFAAAGRFEAVELSPVSTFGMNALAGVDQNNVLTATRNSEVMADPTTALAVECALRRRRADRSATLRFATSHRLVRMQPLDDPGFSRHFRLFALAHAGRDRGDERFELESLSEQLAVWVRLAAALGAARYDVQRVRVEVSDTRIVALILARAGIDRAGLKGYLSPTKENSAAARFGLPIPAPNSEPKAALPPGFERSQELRRMERLADVALSSLVALHPALECRFDFQKLHGLNYYDGLTLSVSYGTSDGRWFPLVDGGFSNWTQSLLTDKKERFLASAIGSELIAKQLAPR